MDPLKVRGEEVHPEAARDGHERAAAAAHQRRQEPGRHGSEAPAEAQTQPGHAASDDRWSSGGGRSW